MYWYIGTCGYRVLLFGVDWVVGWAAGSGMMVLLFIDV